MRLSEFLKTESYLLAEKENALENYAFVACDKHAPLRVIYANSYADICRGIAYKALKGQLYELIKEDYA